MFKENKQHSRSSLFDFTNFLPPKLKSGLENGWGKIFYKNVFCKIDERKFKNLYSEKDSRPNFPVNILIGLEMLKGVYNITDEQLLDNYRYNLQYMVALGMTSIGQYELSKRTIYVFRARLRDYLANDESEDLLKELFYTLRDHFIEKAGIKTHLVRTDSTLLESNVKRLRRYELVLKVLNNLLKVVPEENKKNLSDEIIEVCNRSEEESIFSIFSDKKKSNVIVKGLKILKELTEQLSENEKIIETEEYKIAIRLLGEQTREKVPEEVVEDEETLAEKNEVEVIPSEEISPSSMQTPCDEDATYRTKAGKEHVGYISNIIETADKDNEIQIITEVNFEKNIVSDPAMLAKQIEEIQEELEVKVIVADGAYNSDKVKEVADKRGIQIITTNLNGVSQSKDKFPCDKYEYDEEEGITGCPGGATPISGKFNKKNGEYKAHFNKGVCNACTYKDKCRIKEQKKSYVLIITKKQKENAEYRTYMETPEFEEYKNLRPAIEGTFSGLKRSQGLGGILTRTISVGRYFSMFKYMGCNIKRYMKYLFISEIYTYIRQIRLKSLSFTMNKVQYVCF